MVACALHYALCCVQYSCYIYFYLFRTSIQDEGKKETKNKSNKSLALKFKILVVSGIQLKRWKAGKCFGGFRGWRSDDYKFNESIL